MSQMALFQRVVWDFSLVLGEFIMCFYSFLNKITVLICNLNCKITTQFFYRSKFR